MKLKKLTLGPIVGETTPHRTRIWGEGMHTSLKTIPDAALARSGFEDSAPNNGKNIKSSK